MELKEKIEIIENLRAIYESKNNENTRLNTSIKLNKVGLIISIFCLSIGLLSVIGFAIAFQFLFNLPAFVTIISGSSLAFCAKNINNNKKLIANNNIDMDSTFAQLKYLVNLRDVIVTTPKKQIIREVNPINIENKKKNNNEQEK